MYAPHHVCFGCGPANPEGLHIRSYVNEDGQVVAEWTPGPHHTAFPGILGGGIIGSFLDCHSNWTAAYAIIQRDNLDKAPTTVTAEYHVRLLKPTPLDTVALVGEPVEVSGRRVIVEARLLSGGEVTATCRGVFVTQKEDHPADRTGSAS